METPWVVVAVAYLMGGLVTAGLQGWYEWYCARGKKLSVRDWAGKIFWVSFYFVFWWSVWGTFWLNQFLDAREAKCASQELKSGEL